MLGVGKELKLIVCVIEVTHPVAVIASEQVNVPEAPNPQVTEMLFVVAPELIVPFVIDQL